MKNPVAGCQPVLEARITLFYFFARAPDPHANYWHTLSPLLPEALLSNQDHRKALNESLFWAPTSPNITSDFLPNLTGLFRPGRHQAIETWQLNTLVLSLLNGDLRSNRDQASVLKPVIHLSPAACRRLEAAGCEVLAPRFHFADIHYHRFRTGMGVLVVELRLTTSPLPSLMLNEALHALTRFNAVGWEANCSPRHLSNKERRLAPSLGLVVRALLGDNASEKHWRVFSHVYVRLPSDAAVKDDDLVHLARHYTSDYHLGGDTGETVLMRDFDDVLHCIANEGLATVVLADTDAPSFLQDYYNKATRPAHLPIALLNFHSEQALQHYLAETAVWLEKERVPQMSLSAMAEQQRTLINFDTHFFLPVISRINTHNRMHRAIQQVKHLDQQHQMVARFTHLLSALIEARQRARASKKNAERSLRYCRLAAWGVGAAAYLTVFSIAREILELGEKEWFPGAVPTWLERWSGTIGFSAAIGIGIISLLTALARCRHKHKDSNEDLADELLDILHIHHMDNRRTRL